MKLITQTLPFFGIFFLISCSNKIDSTNNQITENSSVAFCKFFKKGYNLKPIEIVGNPMKIIASDNGYILATDCENQNRYIILDAKMTSYWEMNITTDIREIENLSWSYFKKGRLMKCESFKINEQFKILDVSNGGWMNTVSLSETKDTVLLHADLSRNNDNVKTINGSCWRVYHCGDEAVKKCNCD